MTRALLLSAALAVSACADVPTGPDRSNPYDPAFEGSRVVSAPADVRLAAAPEFALSWTDSGSFETGYRVERATVPPSTFDPEFRTVGVTAPDVTTFAQAQPASAAGYLYRVVGLAGGRDRESAPSRVVRARVPATTSRGFDVEAAQTVSADGLTVYGIDRRAPVSLLAINVLSGRRRWAVAGPTALLRQVADGRLVAVLEPAPSGAARVVVVGPDGAVLRTVELEQSADCQLSGVDDAVARVVGTCRPTFAETVPAVWALSDGGKTSLPGLSGGAGVGLSPDGEIAMVRSGSSTLAFDLGQQRTLWSVPRTGTPVFSADGRLVQVTSAGFDDGLLRTETGEPEPGVPGARLDESGRYVYTTDRTDGGATLVVTTFRLGDPDPVRAFALPGPPSILALTVLPEGGLTALYSERSTTLIHWEPGSAWEVVE